MEKLQKYEKFSHASLFGNTRFNRKHGTRKSPFQNMESLETKSQKHFNNKHGILGDNPYTAVFRNQSDVKMISPKSQKQSMTSS